MSTPRVSVVIPAYNAAGFIEGTLETVAAQTMRDFELVVIDDGSGDDTKGIVDRFIQERGLTGRCVRQPNKKIAGARNAGVREAKTDFIAFLDHDDVWYPEKLEVSMSELDAHPGCDLVCHHEYVVSGGKRVRLHRNGPWCEDMYDRLLFGGNALSPSCVTVRRSKVLEVGGFRENPGYNTVEDYDLWIRLSKVCRMRFIDRALGEYKFDEGGASRRTIYHHTNLERLLRDHFRERFPGRPGFWDRVRMRRRLSVVYRSCLGLLSEFGDDPEAEREYAWRMLQTFPLDLKNLARASLWAVRSLCRG